jgi:hypothetical protein
MCSIPSGNPGPLRYGLLRSQACCCIETRRQCTGEWCDTWLAGYATRRRSTVRQAEVHIARIKTEFGSMPLAAIRPSHVRNWTARWQACGPLRPAAYG